jgi:hypothetical protein
MDVLGDKALDVLHENAKFVEAKKEEKQEDKQEEPKEGE